MAEDPLAKWERRTGQAAAPAVSNESSRKEPPEPPGEASGDNENSPTRYRLYCLEVRPLRDPWLYPAYTDYVDMLTDGGDNPSFVALMFHHVLIVIHGRNLGSIVAGMRMRTQWHIAEDAAPPADRKAQYVESLEIITENIPQAFTALLKSRVKSAP